MSTQIPAWVDKIVGAVQQELSQRTRLPEVTYRLQFHPDNFGFRDAAIIVDYLRDLGISDVYSSPYLKARSGSTHGYDVIDHAQLNPELGSEEDYEAFAAALREQGLGQILDIVPNHMGVGTNENAWWNDVLENGPSSPYADYFDIDWRPVKPELKNKILLPVLGDQYGQVLESGQLQLGYQDGAFSLNYWENRLPIDPGSYAQILSFRLEELQEELDDEAEELLELQSIITALEYLPSRTDTDADRKAERQREKEIIKHRLQRLVDESSPIADFIDRNLEIFNGDTAQPESFDLLDKLLSDQAYRLSHWKAASDEINYRRFFDINELAALCMEEPRVFEDTHKLIFDLLVRGAANGVRIDHIDGLLDPETYLWRLQWGYVRALGRRVYESLAEEVEAAGDSSATAATAASTRHAPVATLTAPNEAALLGEAPAWEDIEPGFLERLAPHMQGPPPSVLFPATVSADNGHEDSEAAAAAELLTRDTDLDEPLDVSQLPLYVVVEKILEGDEQLPAEWPTAGTTGYDFMNLCTGLFVESGGWDQLVRLYTRFTGRSTDFEDIAYRTKLLILRVAMSSELQMLAHRVNRLSEQHRRTRDFTLNNLRTALREILACFPVYRTYIGDAVITERDRHLLRVAVAQAKRRNPAMDAAVFDFVRDTLLLETPPNLSDKAKAERLLFAGRFQQVTSPVMAKGIEDTSFYRYFPLVSLNEVGGAPHHGAVSVEAFHEENRRRLKHRPRSMVSSTSHDTKRSEDVRARISILSDVPILWRKAVNRWARLNRRHRSEVDGLPAPSRNDEYLYYQTLLGMWPLEDPDEPGYVHLIERLQTYMEKATREAKERTSWINSDPDYDAAIRDFVARTLERTPRNRFLTEFRQFNDLVVNWGLYTALSQQFLKLTAPGVPDIYQGQELWDFSLVDPDNRRPVDFQYRRELLADVQAGLADVGGRVGYAGNLAREPRDLRLKLLVTWQTLQFRRQHDEMFHSGEYVPVNVHGEQAACVCAFHWRWQPDAAAPPQVALVVAPRHLPHLTPLPENGEPRRPEPPLGEAVWRDTQLDVESLRDLPLVNLFTGQSFVPREGRLQLSEVLSDFPVALLVLNK